MTTPDETRILLSRSAAQRLAATINRRRFLAMGGGAAAAAVLAACGSSSTTKDTSPPTTRSGSTAGPTTTAATGGSTAGSAGTTGTTPSAASTPATSATSGNVKRDMNVFTWAEYDDPELLKGWGNINLTIYNSNEEAIQRLSTSKGSSGFDMVVPTGVYIAQMAKENLLEKLDLARIPNFANLDPIYANQPWDPGNAHSVCKNWGTTGWIYDTTRVKTTINNWSDFIKVAQTEASGSTSLLDAAPDLCGIYFWANGINWTTEKSADLDACEKFMVDELAKHVKAFDSYPGINLTQGNYALSQVFNGDARQGLLSVEEAGGDPKQYVWGIGAPKTELWMDNWCIVKGAKNPDAAYDFINFILDPKNSVKDLQFHGYNTGIRGLDSLIPADLKFKQMVFFTKDEVARMQSGAVNSAQDRLVSIYSKVKAAAGG